MFVVDNLHGQGLGSSRDEPYYSGSQMRAALAAQAAGIEVELIE
jgi:hypothetical protein